MYYIGVFTANKNKISYKILIPDLHTHKKKKKLNTNFYQ